MIICWHSLGEISGKNHRDGLVVRRDERQQRRGQLEARRGHGSPKHVVDAEISSSEAL